MLLLFGINAYAERDIEIYLDGEKLPTEVNPVNIDERVLVPMRVIFEALGAEVSWDDSAKTVWATRNGQFIAVNTLDGTLGSGVYNSDGEVYWVDRIDLDVPARIIDDFTYVPVRAVSETLGAYVTWDGEAERVLVDSRKDITGVVYYASDSDFQKLYSVGKNGLGRYKLSDRSVKELEIYDKRVYYLDKNTNYLCRAGNGTGEEVLLDRAVAKVAVADGFVYYQELDGGGRKSGILYRMNTETKEVEQLTDTSVLYAEKYKDLIYFNINGYNEMFAVTLDGSALMTIDLGESVFSRLYPFNCHFYGDYILVEDGVWFGNLIRCNLDGTDVHIMTQDNAIIVKGQQHDDNIIYMRPEEGQDIYCMKIDGSDRHLVHKGDPLWLDIDIMAQWGDMVYYKHPMRQEVYRVSLDGSVDEYVCYADSIQIHSEKLFSAFQGMYMGNLDGSDMYCLYDKAVKGFAVIGKYAYAKDAKTTKLYMSDFYGRGGFVTCDACGEWVEYDF